ncbi:MAG: TRAP transporter permease [Syntrophorhabdaceae bacterium]|nr:TRAP transporter permease [Syntrophorhabdaceae bacterium]
MTETKPSAPFKPKKFPGFRRLLISVIAVSMALFHLYTAGGRMLPGVQQRTVHLSFVLALVYLIYPLKTKSDESKEDKVSDEERPFSIVDGIFLILSFSIGLYVFLEYEALSFRMGEPNIPDNICGTVAILLILEATRRVLGWSVVIICGVCFLYLIFGTHLPLSFSHTGFSLEQIVNFISFSTDGVLGPALAVSSTVIAVFIIFGAFLQVSGAGQMFIDIGMSLFGKFRGGPAKASVLADTLFGMITGSQVANVAAVGTFTIPLMKKVGYKGEIAAVIEAVGATGAMIMPPVMGAAAFIIPEIIGGTYLDVCKAAIIPALLWYATLYMIVELQAAKMGLKKIPKEELPRIRDVLKDKGHMVLPIAVLIFSLVFMGATASRAAFWGTLFCFLISQIKGDTRMGLKKLLAGLEAGAKGTVLVAICCASAGIITGTVGMAALGERFSDILITIAGGNLLFLLVLTMLASLVLGLPLPPVTCYLILAVLAAPAMIKAGVHPMAAHLFVFFFGTLGNISPPVAPTSFTAAGIAKSDPIRTTNLAFIYSLPGWLVPFLFVYSPEVILKGSTGMIILRVFTSFIAICTMATAFQGYLLHALSWPMRLSILVAGLILIYPHWMTDVIGYSFLLFLLSLHVIAHKKTYIEVNQ